MLQCVDSSLSLCVTCSDFINVSIQKPTFHISQGINYSEVLMSSDPVWLSFCSRFSAEYASE